MLISRLPLIVSLLLALLLGAAVYLQVAELFNVNQPTTEGQQRAPANVANLPMATPEKNYNIASFKLFGNENEVKVKPQPVLEKLPVTRLKLTLTGVVAGKIDEENGALIEGADRSTNYYKIGDTLPGNATLNRIFPDRVVIERSGKLENLYFSEDFSSGNSITAVRNDDDEGDTTQQAVQPAARQIDSLGEARKQSIKDRLSKLRQRISNSNN